MRSRWMLTGLVIAALGAALVFIVLHRGSTGISSPEDDALEGSAAPVSAATAGDAVLAVAAGKDPTPGAARSEASPPADPDADVVPIVESPRGGFGVEVTLTEEKAPPPAGVSLRLEVRAIGGWRGEHWDATSDAQGVARFGPFPAPMIPRRRARDAFLVLWSPISSGVGIWDERFVYRKHLLGTARSGWGDGTDDPATGVRWIRVHESAMRGVRVAGRVIDEADRPLSAVYVEVEGVTGSHYRDGTTDGDGRFSVRVSAPGRLKVRLEALWNGGGHSMIREETVDVPATGLTDAVLCVPGLPSIAGIVHDSSGRPVAGLALVLRLDDSARCAQLSFGHSFSMRPSPLLDRRVLTGPDGRFRLPLTDADTSELELAVDDGKGHARPLLSPLGPPRDDVALVVDPHGVQPIALDAETGAEVLAEISVFAPADAEKPRRHSIGWDHLSPVEKGVMAAPGTRVRVVAKADGYAAGEATHVVSDAIGFDPVELPMTRPTGRATVRLRFEDPDARPLPWPRTLFLQGTAGAIEVAGDVEGVEFVTRALAPGRYDVSATPADDVRGDGLAAGAPSDGPWRFLLSASVRIDVGADGDFLRTISTRRGGALRVHIRYGDEDDAALPLWWDVDVARGEQPAAHLALYDRTRDGRWFRAIGIHSGELESRALDVGLWTLRWKAYDGSGWVARERAVNVEAGVVVPVTIDVDESLK